MKCLLFIKIYIKNTNTKKKKILKMTKMTKMTIPFYNINNNC